MEMKQEAEVYRQQLELERLKGELQQYRSGFSNLPQLPAIPQDQRQHSLVSITDMRDFSKLKYYSSLYLILFLLIFHNQGPYDWSNMTFTLLR